MVVFLFEIFSHEENNVVSQAEVGSFRSEHLDARCIAGHPHQISIQQVRLVAGVPHSLGDVPRSHDHRVEELHDLPEEGYHRGGLRRCAFPSCDAV